MTNGWKRPLADIPALQPDSSTLRTGATIDQVKRGQFRSGAASLEFPARPLPHLGLNLLAALCVLTELIFAVPGIQIFKIGRV